MRPSRHLAPASALLAFTLAEPALANVPEFEDALRGRARKEYFEVCPTASTVGSACAGTVCGKSITLAPGGNPVSRDITIDGQTFNLHSPQNKPDLAVADLLNATCDSSFAAASDTIALQDMLITDVAMRTGVSARAPTTLSAGLFYERGSDNNAAVAPFSFGHSLSPTQFVNLNAALSFSSRPDAKQFGIAAMPSWALKVETPRVRYSVGAYAPLHFAHASISVIDESVTQWAVGGGGIGTFSTKVSSAELSGGLALAARQTHSATTLPGSALVRVTHPAGTVVDVFASVAYGLDPLNAGTGFADLRAGAAFGEWELAYRALLGTGYTAHVIGFMYSYELAGQGVLDEAPAGAEPTPAPKTRPTPATPPPPTQPPKTEAAPTEPPTVEPAPPPPPVEPAPPPEPPATDAPDTDQPGGATEPEQPKPDEGNPDN